MADLELADFLTPYPSSFTPGLQELVSKKKEFGTLGLDPNEKLPSGRGKLLKRQELTKRLLRAYDSLFITSDAGTGKSCDVLGFFEYALGQNRLSKINPEAADKFVSHISKAVALAPGREQRKQIRYQLVCKCSDGHFETDNPRPATTRTGLQRVITGNIAAAGYTIQTYQKFARDLSNKYPNIISDDEDKRRSELAALRQEFNNTAFWLDEAQFLNSRSPEKRSIWEMLWIIAHECEGCKWVLTSAYSSPNRAEDVIPLLNLFLPRNGVLPPRFDLNNLTQRDYDTLFAPLTEERITGGQDPITAIDSEILEEFDIDINEPDDFPDLPSLKELRKTPRRKAGLFFRGQIPADFFDTPFDINRFEPWIRGRISYVRASSEGIEISYEGEVQNMDVVVNQVKYKSQVPLYVSMMSDFQRKHYLKARKKSGRSRESLIGERQAANFVYPDGSYGYGETEEEKEERRELQRKINRARQETADVEDIAIRKYAKGGKGVTLANKKRPDGTGNYGISKYMGTRDGMYYPTLAFKTAISTVEDVEKYSCKFGAIIRGIKEIIENGEKGICFVYGDFRAGSGVVDFAHCLESVLGFSQYNYSDYPFKEYDDGTLSFCASQDKSKPRVVSSDIPKSLRYTLLIGDGGKESIKQSALELLTSKENFAGEYIKVVICSRVGKEGINLNNIIRIDLTEPQWNEAGIYQALFRGIRTGSHRDLIENARLEGNTKPIEVKVYKHAAVTELPDGTYGSIDLAMYQLSEKKDRVARTILRAFKRVSVVCQILKQQNTIRNGKDGSSECDYDVCVYDCFDGPVPQVDDYSTYDINFAQAEIDEIRADLIGMFRRENRLTLRQIEERLGQDRRPKLVLMALENLVHGNVELRDRFGFPVFLREENGTFFTSRLYPGVITPGITSTSYYSETLIAIENPMAQDEEGELDLREIYPLKGKKQSKRDYEAAIYEVTYGKIKTADRIKILEQAIYLRYIEEDESPLIDAILEALRPFWFVLNRPTEELEAAMRAKIKPRKKSKTASKGSTMDGLPPIKQFELDQLAPLDENEPLVAVHVLGNINSVDYNNDRAIGSGGGHRNRILNLSEGERWLDMDEVSLLVYRKYLKKAYQDRIEEVIPEDVRFYGIVSKGKFKFIDRELETATGGEDLRKKGYGIKYSSKSVPLIFYIMMVSGIPPPDSSDEDLELPNEENLESYITEITNSEGPSELLRRSGKELRTLRDEKSLDKNVMSIEEYYDLIKYIYDWKVNWDRDDVSNRDTLVKNVVYPFFKERGLILRSDGIINWESRNQRGDDGAS